MVTDRAIKAKDLMNEVRANASTIDQKVLGISAINQMNYEQIKRNWKLLPDEFKTHSKNLGCA
jgi:hypothetical protein